MAAPVLPERWYCLLEMPWQNRANLLLYSQKEGGKTVWHSYFCTSSAKWGYKVKVSVLYLPCSGRVTPTQWALQVSFPEGKPWKERGDLLLHAESGLVLLLLAYLVLVPQLTNSSPWEDFCVHLCPQITSWNSADRHTREICFIDCLQLNICQVGLLNQENKIESFKCLKTFVWRCSSFSSREPDSLRTEWI